VSEVRAERNILEEDEREEAALPARLGIRHLAQDAAIYGSTRVLLKAFAFVLVPVYAHYLSRAQFGVLELVLAFTAFVDSFIDLSGVLARFYYDRDEIQWRRKVITTFLLIESVYPFVLIGGLVLASPQIVRGLIGHGAPAFFLMLALGDLFLTNIVDVPMALTRLRRKPWTFAGYAATRGVTQLVLTVLLVVVFKLGVKGILIGSFAAACVVFVVTSREYVRDLTRRIDRETLGEMVAFGWPTIVSATAFYTLNLLDRFIVRHYHGLADNGLYGVAFRYAQIVAVAAFAFQMGWPQWHYSWLHSGRHERMVARGANYFLFAMGFVTVVVAAWILPIFHVLMPERFWAATRGVAPLCLASLASGAYLVSAVGLAVTKRMRLIGPIALVSALVAVGLYFLLIPPFSFVGAAWATVASFVFLTVAAGAVAHRLYPIPWQFRRLVPAAALTFGLAIASLAVDAWVPFAASLPVRVAITLAFPLVLYAVGFFPPSDLASLRRLLRLRSA